jgi:NitT/TauT family transport system substrate-binding protein
MTELDQALGDFGPPDDAPTHDSGFSRRDFVARGAGAVAGASALGSLLAYGARAASLGPAAAARSLADVSVLDILQPGMFYCAEYIADLNGYYKQAGLNVSVDTTRGSAPAIAAIAANKATTAWVGGVETMLAIDKGAPLVNIAMSYYRSTLGIVSLKSKPVLTPQQFRGKTIGVPSVGGTSELSVNLILGKAGIPLSDVNKQIVGPTPGSFELVRQGRVDAFVIGGGQIPIFAATFPDVAILRTGKYILDGICFVANKDSLAQNKAALRAYLTAVRKGMLAIQADRKNGYRNVMAQLKQAHPDFPELQDPKVAKQTFQFYVTQWFEQGRKNVLRPTNPVLWKRIYDQLVKVGSIKGGQNPSAWLAKDVAV